MTSRGWKNACNAWPEPAPGPVFADHRPPSPVLAWAIAASLGLHALALLFPSPPAPLPTEARRQRLEAQLGPAAAEKPSSAPSTAASRLRPAGTPRLAVTGPGKGPRAQPGAPTWTTAEKREMDRFLDELGASAATVPSLAQRALAMARTAAVQQARDDDALLANIERLPGSPPVDAFGLELYMDALVKKLNRSAAFVRNEPRQRGRRTASVQLRVNPDGTLRHFTVLNAADQQDEIAFIQRVVEQASPFAAFPAELRQSAGSLSMVICIQPPRAGEGGIGFTRQPGQRGC